MTAADGERGSSADAMIAAVVVILAASLPYLSTIDDYFLQDDFGVIQLMAQRPWTMFFRWFTMPWMENIWLYTPDEIRPFVALSYVMTAWWGAAEPSAHHVLNVALHAANGLLVMGIARTAAALNRVAAVFAAVIFVALPLQVESVAWITGRVDSMPTLFYLAAFLAYARWRCGHPRAYLWSLVWFFVALFSKQNTITLPAALIAFDIIVLGRPVRPVWTWLRAYVPFILLTAGFLWLRYAVVGTVVRESQLTGEGFRLFADIAVRHSQRIVFGHLSPLSWLEWTAVVVLVAVTALAWTRLALAHRRRLALAAIFFGVVWCALGVAPIVVAGYESPRHVYLASAGWAVLLGVALHTSIEARRSRLWTYSTGAAAAAVLVAYSVQLLTVVEQWNRSAEISQRSVAGLEREATSTPPGSLVIVGVPASSWEWASPFMARPPYVSSDLTTRVHIITPIRLHCCRSQWLDHTRAALEKWRGRAIPAPVVALYFNPSTGAMSRLTDQDYPGLRMIVLTLLEIDSAEALDRALVRMLEDLVSTRPPVVSAPAS